MLLRYQLFAPLHHITGRRKSHTYSYVSDRNKPTPVRRRLSLTHASLENLNPGGVEPITLINVWLLKAISYYSMLHLCSVDRATLVPNWAGSFSNFNAAGKNGSLYLSCRSCPQTGGRSLSYKRCSAS